jgi:hypothetical protein
LALPARKNRRSVSNPVGPRRKLANSPDQSGTAMSRPTSK